jgi:polyisoprenoid-binding protein YceI
MMIRIFAPAVFILLAVCFQQPLMSQNETAVPNPVKSQPMVVVGPENSRVEFIGTHVGDDPRPRLGGFREFRGYVGLNPEKTAVDSLSLSFDMNSIWTEFDNLTSHLKTADFFETASYPTAQFVSSRVVNLPNGGCNIQGQLTLHGQTTGISIPASYEINPQGLKLTAQFFLDRTEFGMDKMLEGVEKLVSVQFTVGQPDRKQAEGDANRNEEVAVEDFVILGPANSAVEFVGTHVGDDPKPRLGGFRSFRGLVGIDPAGKSIQSLQLQFQIGSIWTEFDQLTTHLLTADFFDAEKFPSASFISQQIVPTGPGTCTISGLLTMLDTSVEVNIPAQFEMTEQGLALKSQFVIDRSEFGMNKMTDGVETPVSIRFTIGVPDRKHQELQNQREVEQQQLRQQQESNGQTARLFLPKMLQY